MKTKIATIAVVTILATAAYDANAQQVPEWVKANAGWWAAGQISDSDFVSAIQYLIGEGIIVVEAAPPQDGADRSIPEWVKTTAGWWADGTIDSSTFLQSIQYLIGLGIIQVPNDGSQAEDAELTRLQGELEECQEIKSNYARLECEDAAKLEITTYQYRSSATPYQVGPATFYYMGPDSDGNSLEARGDGRASLSVRMLVENSQDGNLSMYCSGPSSCGYDIWDGSDAFKYSSTDFVSGSQVIKPGEASEFNMFFGPNIGYGGTEFMYDPGKDYFLRISEPWGSAQIPLDLG